ncbi:hypothetical protein CLV42_11764 [Chitinophaga ginsengisoli]|uniref:Uncharacterized protein n=1 Tax=Chitinophaga ginsengisoli TaxID=363837 RepID=A0A2P8FPP9_9BACT|nr:hypothetical protein CLV42_11764 [Chitinophaga ginsengisoli]
MPLSSVLNNIEYRSLALRSILREEICAELGWPNTDYYNRLKVPDIVNHKKMTVNSALTHDERVKIQTIARRLLSESGPDMAKPTGHILLRDLQNNT